MRGYTNVPAVVVGFEKNGLGVARALHQDGIDCIGLAYPSWNPSWKTNACVVTPAASWTEQGVIETLIAIARRVQHRMPLIITKDEPVLWVSRNRDRLAPFYVVGLPDEGVVDQLMSKERFQHVAEKEGWPIPRTWVVNSPEHLDSQLGSMSFPCILKPQVKNSVFRERAPRKAFIAWSSHELRAQYQLVAQWEKEVVVQEFIEGGDDRIAFCLTYWGPHSDDRTIFSGRKLLQWPPQCGNTAVAEPAPPHWANKMEPLVRAIWERLGFMGLGSIEFKMRLGSEDPVIMEPTVGRTNFQNEVAVINHVNIPSIAYHSLIGTPRARCVVAVGTMKLVDGPAALKSLWWHWRTAGDLPLMQGLGYLKRPRRYMLWRSRDVQPFVASCCAALRSLGSSVLRRFLPVTVKTGV